MLLLWLALARAGEPERDSRQPLTLLLDQDRVPAGGTISGRVAGTWAAPGEEEAQRVLRLVTLDEVGRVTGHVELAREKNAPQTKAIDFALTPAGGSGRLQRLAAIVAPRPKNGPPVGWRVVAEASYRVVVRTAEGHASQILAQWGGPLPKGKDEALWRALCKLEFTGLAASPGSRPGFFSSQPVPVLLRELLGGAPHPLRASVDRGLVAGQSTRQDLVQVAQPALFADGPMAAVGKRFTEEAAAQGGLLPLGYSLGTALSVGRGARPCDLELGSEALEVFRAWLERRYGTLPALNAQWGSVFERWEEVAPPGTDAAKAAHDPRYQQLLSQLAKGDPEQKLPRRNGQPYFVFKLSELCAPGGENFSGWCDTREFIHFAFARHLGEYRALLQAREPQARVGLEGAGAPSAWGGFDGWRVSRALDWCDPGESALNRALLRDFNPALTCLTTLRAGDPRCRLRLWQAWLDGGAWTSVQRAEDLFTGPDLQPTAQARALAEDFRELNGGLTLQRGLAEEHSDAIALYYSPRSQAVHWMLDSRLDGSAWPERAGEAARSKDTAVRAWDAWLALLQDLGYRPRFVHPEQLLAGTLHAKVLILPKVLCVSDAEAAALREFARRGGVVIADSQCGLFDGAGRRRGPPHRADGVGAVAGVLDEDFGIRRVDFWAHEFDGAFHGDATAARVYLEDPLKSVPAGPSSSELRVNEPGVRATGAWRYGRTARELTLGKDESTAAVLSRSSGPGRFIYLNLAMQEYPGLRMQPDAGFSLAGMEAERYEKFFGKPLGGEALRVLIGDMLWEAVGEPSISVRTLAGQPLRGVRRACWNAGGSVLIALLPVGSEPLKGFGPAEPQDVLVTCPRRLHWYAVREGKYLGLGTACPASLESERAVLLAGLPYRVQALRAKSRRLAPQGVFKLMVSLQTSGAGAEGAGSPGRHVLHLEVFDPTGKRQPHYARNVVAESGTWNENFSLGLNEPAGAYRLTVRDTLTGARAELTLLKEGASYAELFPPPVERP